MIELSKWPSPQTAVMATVRFSDLPPTRAMAINGKKWSRPFSIWPFSSTKTVRRPSACGSPTVRKRMISVFQKREAVQQVSARFALAGYHSADLRCRSDGCPMRKTDYAFNRRAAPAI